MLGQLSKCESGFHGVYPYLRDVISAVWFLKGVVVAAVPDLPSRLSQPGRISRPTVSGVLFIYGP